MHYIHNINPILVPIYGHLAVRWYGVSYLLGLIAAILLLQHWSDKEEFDVPKAEVSNFIISLAIFGIFLGGRMGYMLFYSLDSFRTNPLSVFKIWEGGMSSHGGMIGVFLFMVWYAHKYKYSFWNLADNMACTASLGIAFGRLANFINGELWGRVTDVSWGVIFPQTVGLHYGQYTIEQIRAMNLSARHPSQLYQAFCEGFLLFFIMLMLRHYTPWKKRKGLLSASYFILYAIARIAMEFFREPDDAKSVFFGWLTKGQLFSLFMIVPALFVIIKNPGKKTKNAG